MSVIRSMLIAFSTYSRVPVPQVEWTEENRRYSLCFFPLVGAVTGALVWGWLALCGALSFGPLLKGAGAALLPIFITGGIHMDGYMDTCDALNSWQSAEKRLEILKDSRVGAFAVMRFTAYLLLSCALFSEARAGDGPLLMCVFILSRALSAWTLTAFKNARPDGMSDAFARAARARPVLVSGTCYCLICAAVWAALGGWLAPCCLAAAALCVIGYRRMAYREFGGVTGDLAGFFLEVTELTLTAVIVIGGRFL